MRHLALPLALALSVIASTLAAQVPTSQEPSAAAQPSGQTVAEVRVHGNHTTPDEEVIRLSGITIGEPIGPHTVAAIERRLRDSGRFDDVEVRVRLRSIDGTGPATIVLIVREHPVPDVVLQSTPAPVRPLKRLMASGMFLPVLQYTDGYGFTYGARFSFVDTLGRGGRVSVPLTWGGTKRAAIEVEKSIPRGPFDRLFGGASVSRRTNPYYDLDEDRQEIWVGADKRIARVLRAGLHAGLGNVTFGSYDERMNRYGADLAIDTRVDPVFPRNAVYLSGGWERFDPTHGEKANRYRAEARGYLGLARHAVFSVRWQYAGSDAPLPDYAKSLLGGADTLRGYRAGRYAGDNMMAVSAELRLPTTSPMNIGKTGFTLFSDVGTVWDHGRRLQDATWHPGGGVGWFAMASVFQFSVELGFRQGGGARVHVKTGLQF